MIEDWCQQYPSHSIGSLAFGPDGQLYASGGDGASFNWVDFGQGGGLVNRCADPPNEGGALRSQDMRTTSDLTADPVTLDGTVIRIDPSTGAGSAGNPFASSSDANARRIVAYGLRNPFRINFRPGTRRALGRRRRLERVGGDQHARRRRATPSPRTSDGRATRATPRQPGYDNQNLPICETLYGQSNAVTAPFYTYRHSDQVIPGESCPIGGSSIAGLSFAFYGGGPYPAEYDGALFFADYTRRCIWAMERGGTTRPSPSNIKGFVGGAANPVELQIGPDGNLYYVDIGGGTIRRIKYTAGANQPPVAVATANPTSGDIGMTVNFDGSGSSDPNGDALSYAWDLDGDGGFDDSTAVKPSWTYNAAGNYRVSLRVSDGRGGTATDTITIGVGGPKVTISAPTTDFRWAVGQTVIILRLGDRQPGRRDPRRQSDLEPRAQARRTSPETPRRTSWHAGFPGVASGSFPAPDHDYPSELELSLTATDSSGLANTASVQLLPLTTTLRFATNPTGLTLTFNGANATAPFTAR